MERKFQEKTIVVQIGDQLFEESEGREYPYDYYDYPINHGNKLRKLLLFFVSLIFISGVGAIGYKLFDNSQKVTAFKEDPSLNRTITRLEFASLVGKGGTKAELDFKDIPSTSKQYNLIMYSGLNGDKNGYFNPNEPITREDALNLLWNRKGSPTDFLVPKIISDQGLNKAAVAWGYTTGILTGSDGLNLDLNGTMSKKEAELMLKNYHAKKPKLVGFAEALSDSVLEGVYRDSKILPELEFGKYRNISNGEAARAFSHLLTDEFDMSYYGLDPKELPFENPYSEDLYLVGRDVIGNERITKQFVTDYARLQDVLAELTYASVKSSNGKQSFDKKDNFYKEVTQNVTESVNMALTFAKENNIMLEANAKFSPDAKVTPRDIAAIILQLDYLSGTFNKFEITANSDLNINLKMKTQSEYDPNKWPQNKDLYQVILKEVPNNVYDTAFLHNSQINPKVSFDFAREYHFIFTDYLKKIAKRALEKGIDIKFTYYPNLEWKQNVSHKVRVKCEVMKALPNLKLSEIAVTEIDRSVQEGDIFFIDISTHVLPVGFEIPIDQTTIDQVIEVTASK